MCGGKELGASYRQGESLKGVSGWGMGPGRSQLGLLGVTLPDVEALVGWTCVLLSLRLSGLVCHFCGKLRQEGGLQSQELHCKGMQPRPLQAQPVAEPTLFLHL